MKRNSNIITTIENKLNQTRIGYARLTYRCLMEKYDLPMWYYAHYQSKNPRGAENTRK
jgi:hypothetical protein